MNFYGGERRLSEDEQGSREDTGAELASLFFVFFFLPKMRQIFSEEPLPLLSGQNLQTDTQRNVLFLQPKTGF